MTPKEILCQWVDAFNNADVEIISELYDDNAINHQVANEPVIGKEAIKKILEWCAPSGLRGCGFFQIVNNKIIFQRGYWDKLSFLKLHNLPIE
ncbi:YybH family protein [Klebsiella pasteurii]|uniref:YybH family protein n=1 Tax=Klebsiella pasteurii TaxID=2587529 RepID=UPI0011595046|nr:nuclear transport factor 2 family protein [Klebsiella pasteurii]